MTALCKCLFTATSPDICYGRGRNDVFTVKLAVISQHFPEAHQIPQSGIETAACKWSSQCIYLIISILLHTEPAPDFFGQQIGH